MSTHLELAALDPVHFVLPPERCRASSMSPETLLIIERDCHG
jgi:hypothetical protein